MKSYKIFLSIFLIFLLLWGGIAFAKRVSVQSSTANIRSGPGTGYEILWQVEKNHPLNVLRQSSKWFYFSDFENDKGWIHNSLVKKDSTVITLKDKCNIRSGPGKRRKILFTVEKGVPFKVIGKKGNWLHIKHADGDKGWIHKTLCW